MARNYTNTTCQFYGTKYCAALNMESCEKCIVIDENATGIMQDIDMVLKMLPEEGIYRFFSSDECMLCKGEKKNKADCYALVDLGNPEPRRAKRNVLGMKSKTAVGSILPLQLSCCKDCRKRFNTLSGRHIIVTIITAIVVFFLLNYKPIGESIANIHMALPLSLFVASVLGAWFICKASRKNLIKKYSDFTWLNVMDIPGMDELAARNWFELSPDKDISRVIFSKEPLKSGLLTGPMGQEENI
ncbi:MAG: hypothetical protein IKU32_06455 [Clostridia bacterium]|nr:hypothetical protein [Clostridia bacterium]